MQSNPILEKQNISLTSGPFFKPNTEFLIVPNAKAVVYSQFLQRDDIKHVFLPNTIESVDEIAFAGCKNLRHIKLSNNLKKIGIGAFNQCSNLEEINFPDTIELIDRLAFCECEKLPEFLAPKNLKTIGQQSFMWCSSLKSVVCHNELTNVGSKAFAECANLEFAILGDGLKFLGNEAFLDCEKLRFVQMGENVKKIGACAFKRCFQLEKIKLSESLEKLDCNAFEGCLSLEEITIPKNLQTIEGEAFKNCVNLKNVQFKGPIKKISYGVFSTCSQLKRMKVPNSVETLFENSFPKQMNFLYLDKKSEFFVLSKNKEPAFVKTCYEIDIKDGNIGLFSSKNYRDNFVHLKNLKEQGKLKFFPSQNTLTAIPYGQIDCFFTNKNYRRWNAITICAGLNKPTTPLQQQAFQSLLKIYYCIGGFSTKQDQSELAFKYTIKNIIGKDIEDELVLHNKLIEQFETLDPKGQYNQNFAKFFMKYYQKDNNFLTFDFNGENGLPSKKFNYLSWVQSSFPFIEKTFSNKTINGTGKSEVLTPMFVAKHSRFVDYDNVLPGNEEFAKIVGSFGYSKQNFSQMQKVFQRAKTCLPLLAIKPQNLNAINFRLLEKTDPLNFVLGDITNCCMRFGDLAESCIEDACQNPTSGLVVFEKKGKQVKGCYDSILAQAFLWYDKKTKTLCFDNIEIPRKVRLSLEHKSQAISYDELFESVKQCAKNLFEETNKNGLEIKRVTIGAKHNDLRKQLEQNFKLESMPKARVSGGVFSDANENQFVVIEQNSPNFTQI